MADSSVAHAGFLLTVTGESVSVADDAVQAIVVYLAIYAAMNLGVFAVIVAAARRTRAVAVESYYGLFRTAPAHVAKPLNGRFAAIFAVGQVSTALA